MPLFASRFSRHNYYTSSHLTVKNSNRPVKIAFKSLQSLNVRERSQLRESVHKCAELLCDPTALLGWHQSLQDLISHQSIAQIIQMNAVTGENSLLDVH
jgi:hypothetical protein